MNDVRAYNRAVGRLMVCIWRSFYLVGIPFPDGTEFPIFYSFDSGVHDRSHRGYGSVRGGD